MHHSETMGRALQPRAGGNWRDLAQQQENEAGLHKWLGYKLKELGTFRGRDRLSERGVLALQLACIMCEAVFAFSRWQNGGCLVFSHASEHFWLSLPYAAMALLQNS